MLYNAPFGTNRRIQIPRGDNGQGSNISYRYREFYKDVTYPENSIPPNIDFWYDVPLYGKINKQGTAVFLSETNLKQLHTTNRETHYAVDFVADAFKDLRNHFKMARFKRSIEPDADRNELSMLNPTTGWSSINQEYDKYINSIYRGFSSAIANSTMDKKITDFKAFMDIAQRFLLEFAKSRPVTRTGFIISGYSSPHISGLVVEITNKSHEDDFVKYLFMQNSNFEFYRNAAKNFGFLVDRNAPWRLVADLHSPKMRQYMQPYGVGFNNLFESYYYKSHLHDISILKSHMLDFYDSFVETYPFAVEAKISSGRQCKKKTVTKVIKRLPMLNFSNVRQLSMWGISDEYWLKFYLTLRTYETESQWDPIRFDKVYDKAKNYLLGIDMETALVYINDTITSHQNDYKMAKIIYTGVSDESLTQEPASSSSIPTVPWHMNPGLKAFVESGAKEIGKSAVSNLPSGFSGMAETLSGVYNK
tara:strand:+ start:633 stop:2060 length:1428 start_codon:yes stop_codon:yes gene_type:complete